MGCKVEWKQPEHIILTTLTGDISIKDINNNDRTIYGMISEGSNKVHIICDIREIGAFPTHVRMLKQSSDQYLKHPNMGIFVVVGKKNPITKFLSNVISQMARIQLTHVDSIDEALQYLDKHDQRLQTNT